LYLYKYKYQLLTNKKASQKIKYKKEHKQNENFFSKSLISHFISISIASTKTMASTKTDEIPSPPGVTPGGVWGKNKYIGTTTQAAACIGCLCFFLPGLCILLCPLDERDAYKVNDKVSNLGLSIWFK
jgi:hypothetical protein